MSIQNLDEFLVEETEYYSAQEVAQMSRTEKFNAWLEYQGIVGYTDDILEVITALTCAPNHINGDEILDFAASLLE